jgi:hypothetical protein
MPELPDINAYLCALDSRIVGQTLQSVRVASAFVLRTAQPPIADVDGHVVRELRRVGKRIAIGLDNDLWVVIHLMIAGRLHWRAPGVKLSGRNNLAPAPDAATKFSASATPKTKPITAPAARPAANCSPTAPSRACSGPIGRAPWMNSRHSRSNSRRQSVTVNQP